jgi:hypothetical protein
MTVVIDCTGSYLRLNEKDYQICNIENIQDYDNGDEIKASFKKISNCDNSEIITCEMLHGNEGWIEVLKINKR